MTPDQIRAVETSFRRVMAIRDAAAALFYENLFRRDPALRPMFAETDMSAQGVKLMASLGFVVQELKNPAAIAHAVEGLAARHRDLGVTSRDYDTVGAALIDTLQAGLGEDFTPELRAAWTGAYAALSAIMQAGSAPRAA